MNQSGDARMRNLLQISTDLRDQMDEVRELRRALRLAEADRRGNRRIDTAGLKNTEFRVWP
jgi:hypothetical protein